MAKKKPEKTSKDFQEKVDKVLKKVNREVSREFLRRDADKRSN